MQQIGRYRIVRELGRGGMGVVYEAHDPVIDRTVALKTIRNADGLGAEAFTELKERFLREARAAGRLHHPNITAVLDAGTDPETDLAYIAIEFVRGRDLASQLAEGRRFSTDEAGGLAAQVAEALDYAHAHGVVHRDIKPANLLVDERGRVKVTDFGIAHVADSTVTRTGQVLGSPAYMSPEQISGAPVDGRSDIFSLGVVLYQLLTGEKPFPGAGLSTLSYQIVHTEPIPLRKINPALPAHLEEVIARCLAKDPALRYQRASNLAADLHGGTVLSPGPAAAAVPPLPAPAAAVASPGGTLIELPGAPPAPLPEPAVRSRRRALAIGGVLLGVALAVALLLGRDRGAGSADEKLGGAADRAAGRGEVARESVPPPRRAERAPDPSPPGNARIRVHVEHHLSSGTVTLSIDGAEVWSSPLAAKVEKKIGLPLLKKGPKIQFSHEEIDADLELAPGTYDVTARMQSARSKVDDSARERATLRAGQAYRFKIGIDRIRKNVGLDIE